MKKIYLLFLLCVASISGYSQTAASYSFSRTAGVFTSIVGQPGTMAITDVPTCTTSPLTSSTFGSMSTDDGGTTGIPLGFTFSFCGASYTTCTGNANGVLSLSGPVAPYTVTTGDIGGAGWLMPLWRDLFGTCKTAYYQTSGIAGSQVFTLEWNDWATFANKTTAHLNFQVKLYEGSNVIRFCYSTSVLSPTNAVVGIANSSADYQTLTSTSSPNTNTSFNTSCSQPADGSILTFCPPFTVAAITGTPAVCEGSITALSDATASGVWSSASPTVATVGTTGDVTGVAAGTSTISYTVSDACTSVSSTLDVTVNPMPAMITGTFELCSGSITTLADATTGGTWSTSNPVVATVGSASGDVTGGAAGTANIMYTTPEGCFVYQQVTVDPLPTISAGSNVAICAGNSTGLTATGGGTYYWSPASGLSCTNCANPTATPGSTTTYTVTGYSIVPISYSEAFVGGSVPTTQCNSWQSYRASLTSGRNYIGFTIRGTMNTTGISCTDPTVANAVAAALRTATGYVGSSDGQTWYVGTGCVAGAPGCGTDGVELSNQGTCSCATGYSIRPVINNINWGGIDGNTCGAVSQTMEVIFYYEQCSSNATVTVSVNPLPYVYNVTGGGSYCAGGAGVHVGVDTTNAGINYQLYNGMSTSGSPVGGIEAALDFGLETAAGTYTVMATDTTTGCMSAMDGSATVIIIPVVVPSVGISRSTSDTICNGTHTTFMAWPVNGGSTPHYIWRVNGAVVGTDSVAYDYVPADTAMVSVTLASNAVCAIPDTVMSDTLTMIVWPNGIPTVTLSPSPDDTVCEGTTVTVTATPTFGGYGPSYVWVKNTVVVGSSATFTYVPVDGDNIYAVMTSDYMCRLANTAYSNVVDMTVEMPIVPSVTITGHPGMVVGIGKPDTLIATVMNGGTNPTYQWLMNGVIVPGATNSTFIRSSFTNGDSVSCLVTRMDACQLSTINSVVLLVANVGVHTTGTLHADVVLMPNPNKGSFAVKGSLGIAADEEVYAEVTNMLGQNVYTNSFMTHGGNIDAQIQLNSNLASGVYILNLRSSNGNKVFHFVVEQ